MRLLRLTLAAVPLALVPLLLAQQPHALKLSGDYPLAHDPSIAKEGNTYYVYTTALTPTQAQFPIRCSHDLHAWKLCGDIFDAIPEWIQKASPKTRILWAPDISYFNGRYHLYYAYSLFGLNTSGIALATNITLDPKSPNYHWKDEGLVLKSTKSDNYNAIDPNIVMDAMGQPWLAFGSFWSGIKMHRIDAATGKISAKDPKLYSLATREKPAAAPPAGPNLPAAWQAIEAPFIIHHRGYFYLFVSWDLCCRGTQSTYRTMVGRSREVTGPYLDATGKRMLDGGGTQLLAGNSRWVGPGGQSVLQLPHQDYLVFHAYDAVTGKPALQISTIAWKDGWPKVALGTSGEAK
ncbi:MAG TPA: arabinan endo-1,5-alpha-L-arabinosidase [Terracidiphilus sp.]|nr:arabinan endo-1,5-alpha-L-arabinosidase [Terracidiphilus sp.]